ncbi:MAG: hypothetical protein ACI80H_000619 [Pseudoalteromonas distincta]
MLLLGYAVLRKKPFFENRLMSTSIAIPISADLVDHNRLLKYTVCLHLVKKVLDKELATSLSPYLFHTIGSVACFIDKQLDSLNIDQQKQLVENFDALFYDLWQSKYLSDFSQTIIQYNRKHNLECSCTLESITSLFTFINYCKERELKEELRFFGKEIIQINIQKQNCTSTAAIVKTLQAEGKAVVNLLENLLVRDLDAYSKFHQTISYLAYLEHILNLGDDTLDAHRDAKKGILNSALSKLHPIKMAGYLAAHICKTFILHPIKTSYYAPTLTLYYLRNSKK